MIKLFVNQRLFGLLLDLFDDKIFVTCGYLRFQGSVCFIFELSQSSHIFHLLSDGSTAGATARTEKVTSTDAPIHRLITKPIICTVHVEAHTNAAIFTDTEIVYHVSLENFLLQGLKATSSGIPNKSVTALFECDFNCPNI